MKYLLVHSMSEKIVHIIFPSFEKMDHAIPSVRYIAKKAREIGATQIHIHPSNDPGQSRTSTPGGAAPGLPVYFRKHHPM